MEQSVENIVQIMNKENPVIKNKRKKYNNKIVKIIKEFLKENKDLRFIQALTILSIVSTQDRFHEESEITYKRLQAKLLQMKNMKFKVGVGEHHT